MDNAAIQAITDIMKRSANTVVVTGAGISTEAGIPDFRSENGIYRKFGEENVINSINIDAFNDNPEEFYKAYRSIFNLPKVQPGRAHYLLANLEKRGFIKAIVTQNVDGLHQKAGSRNVIPIHGNADQYICSDYKCSEVYPSEYVDSFRDAVPVCGKCRSVLKPNVVLFGEPIQQKRTAWQTIMDASLLMIIGSSLKVMPLSSYVREYSNFYGKLVIINRGPTDLDHSAAIKIEAESAGDVLKEINMRLQ